MCKIQAIKTMKILQTILISLAITICGHAQVGNSFEKPEVGKPMPDFVLHNVTHYKSNTASRADFKGKWLFLDFWFQGCMTCIQSFPSVNAHHKKYKDRLTWMLVGLNDMRFKNTQQFYEKLSAKQGLEMPSAYDSVLAKQWNIYSMPHIFIIDPEGIVRAITGGRDLTSDKIERLLSGEDVAFYPKDIERPDFVVNLASAKETTGGKMLYRSVLCEWNGETQRAGVDLDQLATLPDDFLSKGYSMSMIPLYALYNYAYWGRWSWGCGDNEFYGQVYPRPILEIENKEPFDFDFNFNVGKGTYNYSLAIPLKEMTAHNIKRYMQEDLHRAFKYEVSVEKREMPVWKLIAKDGVAEKLKTKGGKRFATDGSHAVGYTLTNWPVNYLVGSLSYFLEEKIPEPFVDGTGIVGNIDFSIEADMTDFEEVKAKIRKQGLEFVKSTHVFDVIVIKDKVRD